MEKKENKEVKKYDKYCPVCGGFVATEEEEWGTAYHIDCAGTFCSEAEDETVLCSNGWYLQHKK